MADKKKGFFVDQEKVMKVLAESMEEILKDALTGYDSPIKEVLREEKFVTELKDVARQMLKQIISDEGFHKSLKDKLIETAAENLFRR